MNVDNLYKEYYEMIRQYLLRFVSEDEASDLVQEVFIKVSNSINDFKGNSSIKTWIYRIASNTAKDFLKSRFYKASKFQDEIVEDDLLEFSNQDHFSEAEEHVILDEMNTCIRDFIYRLPYSYSSILVLSDLEGYRAKEIAEILDISLSAVKIRLHRARSKLKTELANGCSIALDNQNNFFCEPIKTS